MSPIMQSLQRHAPVYEYDFSYLLNTNQSNQSALQRSIEEASEKQHALVLQAFKTEPMLTDGLAPGSLVINDLTRHVRELRGRGVNIHAKMLAWRSTKGYESRITYYGLYRDVRSEHFIWNYDVSLLEAFDYLEKCGKSMGFEINPRQLDLSIPEKLQIYRFFVSMVK